MPVNKEELKEILFELMKEEVKDLWKEEDQEFLKQLASDAANQKILMITSDKPEEHEQNLRHLAATLEGEVIRKGLKLRWQAKEKFIRILGSIIKTLAISFIKTQVGR